MQAVPLAARAGVRAIPAPSGLDGRGGRRACSEARGKGVGKDELQGQGLNLDLRAKGRFQSFGWGFDPERGICFGLAVSQGEGDDIDNGIHLHSGIRWGRGIAGENDCPPTERDDEVVLRRVGQVEEVEADFAARSCRAGEDG